MSYVLYAMAVFLLYFVPPALCLTLSRFSDSISGLDWLAQSTDLIPASYFQDGLEKYQTKYPPVHLSALSEVGK